MGAGAQRDGVGVNVVADRLAVQRDDHLAQGVFLGDGGRKPNCAGEGLAVLHAQVDDRGGIVHKEADVLCVHAVGHGQGVRTLGQSRGVNDRTHRRGVRRGDRKGGVQIGGHARRIADVVYSVQGRAQIRFGLVVHDLACVRVGVALGADGIRQIALAVGEFELQIGYGEVLAVGRRHQLVIDAAGVSTGPEAQCDLVAVAGCIVGEIVAVDGHRKAVQAVVLPFQQRGDVFHFAVVGQVVVCQRQGVVEVAVAARRGKAVVRAVLQHLAHGQLHAVQQDFGVGVVAAVVGRGRDGAAHLLAVGDVRADAVDEAAQLLDVDAVDLGGRAVVTVVRCYVELDILVVEQLVGCNVHLIQAGHAAIGFCLVVPVAGAVKAVVGSDFRAGQRALVHRIAEPHAQLVPLRDGGRHGAVLPHSQLHCAAVVRREVELRVRDAARRGGLLQGACRHAGPLGAGAQIHALFVLRVGQAVVEEAGHQYLAAIFRMADADGAVRVLHTVLAQHAVERGVLRHIVGGAERGLIGEGLRQAGQPALTVAPEHGAAVRRDDSGLGVQLVPGDLAQSLLVGVLHGADCQPGELRFVDVLELVVGVEVNVVVGGVRDLDKLHQIVRHTIYRGTISIVRVNFGHIQSLGAGGGGGAAAALLTIDIAGGSRRLFGAGRHAVAHVGDGQVHAEAVRNVLAVVLVDCAVDVAVVGADRSGSSGAQAEVAGVGPVLAVLADDDVDIVGNHVVAAEVFHCTRFLDVGALVPDDSNLAGLQNDVGSIGLLHGKGIGVVRFRAVDQLIVCGQIHRSIGGVDEFNVFKAVICCAILVLVAVVKVVGEDFSQPDLAETIRLSGQRLNRSLRFRLLL